MKYKFSETSLKRLEDVSQYLQNLMHELIEITPVDFAIVEGRRSLETQRLYIAKGLSQTLNSKHLTGNAVDIAPVVNGRLI